MVTKNDLVTGDVVLARIVDDVLAFEFYGWWDNNRRICCLVAPSNGLTFLTGFDQILCRVTKDKIIHVNPESFKKRQKR